MCIICANLYKTGTGGDSRTGERGEKERENCTTRFWILPQGAPQMRTQVRCLMESFVSYA